MRQESSPSPTRLAALLLPVLLAPPAAAQGEEAPSLAGLRVPEGLRVTLWAESPQLYNPTAIDVDAQGRVWVTEAVNYRRWGGRNPGLEHPKGDRVVVLEDADGDGRCDRSTVFAQSEDLVAPLGVAVLGDRVYVSCSPSLYLYRDRDADLVADEREVFLTGFGGHDHDHGLHSLVLGPDGRLHFAVGNAGPHVVQDADGQWLRSGSIYVGGGAERADNRPGLVSDDGRAWTGGLVLRVDLDGADLRVIGSNFRNEYEVALDSYGDAFTADNDDDGNEGCRTLWVMEGGDHGYFSADGTRYWQADRRPGQPTARAHWHQDDPGVVPAGSINGAGGPTGVCVYEGALLAKWIDGALLNADAGRGVVYAHRPRAEGAGFELERDVLIRADPDAGGERARWFRPSDVAVGPDGAVYVADWYDPGVGGHLAGDRAAYGRILRVAPAGKEPRVPELDASTAAGRRAILASPAPNVRFLALAAWAGAELQAATAELRAIAEEAADPRLRARALWLLGWTGEAGRADLEQALASADERDRLVAFRALRAVRTELLPLVERLRDDPSPAVRRELLVALRDVPARERLDVLVPLAQAWDGADRWYLEAVGIAARGIEGDLYAELAASVGDQPSKWTEPFAGLAWRLHPEGAVDSFYARAMDATLSPAARHQAVEALAFVPTRAAAQAMLTLALAAPKDVRELATWWVRHRATNDWRDYGLLEQLPGAGIEKAELVWESDVLREAETVPVDVPIEGAETLWLEVADGGDGMSCDWADWIAPRLAGPAGAVKLAEREWLSAEAAWGAVRRGANCEGGPLQVGGERFEEALGTHALSRIAFRVPPGCTRFTARVGPDDGGTSQGGATSVRFRVLVERPPDRSRLEGLEARVVDTALAVEERVAAAVELAAEPEGGLFLIRAADRNALPHEAYEPVAEALRRNPDAAVRTLASQHFRRVDDAGREMPSLLRIAALDGDPARGAALFFEQRALCSTCHIVRGRGGDVGPELTRIGWKYGKQEVLDAILNPSAGICFGYDTWILETRSGRVLSGFILADGADVVLKDTAGKRHVVAAEEIVARQRQSISAMPDDVALGLEPQELADIAAFLLDDPDAPPTLGEEERLFNGRDMSGWTFHLNDPSARMEDVWSVVDGTIVCKGQPIGYLRTEADYESFVLTLEWRFDPEKGAGNSGVLMRMTGEDKVWPDSIEAQLQSGSAGDIWNIGSFPMQVDETRTEGRHTGKLQPSSERPLGEWNRYEITLDGGELRLVVNGVLQNSASWCERKPGKICLQSEGAWIQFRDIRLTPILD